MPGFSQRVYAMVRRVPRGRIVSYGAVAALLGRPRAARGVGQALSALPDESDVPWWRVVNRNGEISMRAAPGPLVQRRLLEAEGVVFDRLGRASWKRFGWQPLPVHEAVAVAIPSRDGPELLLVRRPADDGDLPGAWGLPAGRRRPGEPWTRAVRRVGSEKLGVHLRAGRFLARGELERPGYLLRMRLYEAALTGGEPVVPQPHPDITQYTACRWGPAASLRTAARRGSLCSKLLLEADDRGREMVSGGRPRRPAAARGRGRRAGA
jgi:O-6-methylguanine DNA methyltransferase